MTPTATGRDPGYLDHAERHSGRRLACRAELAAMLRAAAEPGMPTMPTMKEDFDRALFLARFWEGASGILRRTGPGAEEVAKLTAELAGAVTEVAAIVTRLLAAGAPAQAEHYAVKYRPADLAGMERLALLLSDLAALKRYELHAGEPGQ
jgi:hypothetical protein